MLVLQSRPTKQTMNFLEELKNNELVIWFSTDGQAIASASVDQSIRIRSLAGTIIEVLQGHGSTLKNVAFSPDSKMLASVSTDTTLKLWTHEGNLLKTVEHEAGLGIRAQV